MKHPRKISFRKLFRKINPRASGCQKCAFSKNGPSPRMLHVQTCTARLPHRPAKIRHLPQSGPGPERAADVSKKGENTIRVSVQRRTRVHALF